VGTIETRYDAAVARLVQAAQPDRPAPPELSAYLDKVRRNAYAITDEDIEALTSAGYSDDVIFELTVAAAVAAGVERRAAGLGVLS
jgi:alkylhydroperoxidase family enzyme